MRTAVHAFAGVSLLVAVAVMGGCERIDLDGVELIVPGLTTVTVELINDTPFDVDPHIRFDDDEGFLAQLFPADELTTGLLGPGDALAFDFDCDELGLVFSDRAEQLDRWGVIAEADESSILTRDDDFGCGDLVRFRFMGDFDQFGVVVSVNGVVVD
jgi:hypothetical protein